MLGLPISGAGLEVLWGHLVGWMGFLGGVKTEDTERITGYRLGQEPDHFERAWLPERHWVITLPNPGHESLAPNIDGRLWLRSSSTQETNYVLNSKLPQVQRWAAPSNPRICLAAGSSLWFTIAPWYRSDWWQMLRFDFFSCPNLQSEWSPRPQGYQKRRQAPSRADFQINLPASNL